MFYLQCNCEHVNSLHQSLLGKRPTHHYLASRERNSGIKLLEILVRLMDKMKMTKLLSASRWSVAGARTRSCANASASTKRSIFPPSEKIAARRESELYSDARSIVPRFVHDRGRTEVCTLGRTSKLVKKSTTYPPFPPKKYTHFSHFYLFLSRLILNFSSVKFWVSWHSNRYLARARDGQLSLPVCVYAYPCYCACGTFSVLDYL